MDQQLELALVSPYTVRLTLADALDFFWKEDWSLTVKSRSTVHVPDRIKEFCRMEGISYVDEIGKRTVEGFRRWLKEQGFKDNTINSHHAFGTRWFNFLYECKEEGKVSLVDFSKVPLPNRNPFSMVPKVNEDQFAENVAWPKKAIKKVITTALAIGDLGLAEIVEFLYTVPIRQCDLFRLTDKNVNLAQGIVQGVQKKLITRRNPSGHPYLNALTPQIERILKRRMELAKPGTTLFTNKGLQKRWEKVRELAGYPKMKLKHLRPSHSTLLMDNGTDVETVKNVLGHTTLRMIPNYRQMSIAHLKKAASKVADDKTEIMGVK